MFKSNCSAGGTFRIAQSIRVHQMVEITTRIKIYGPASNINVVNLFSSRLIATVR